MTRLDDPHVIDVFVHLAHGFGASSWNERFKRGQIPGINEPFAYGYYRAAEHGCRVKYSEDKAERKIERLFRLGMRYFLQFDLLHAWRNRKEICKADVIWTHTESQNLAVLSLLWLMRPKRRPKLIAQVVWLLDRWRSSSAINRWVNARLLSKVDVLTTLSPDNLKAARELFPNIRSELVLFAIRSDEMSPPRQGSFHEPVRIVSLGNDEHRDWETLVSAIKNVDNYELRIASAKVDGKLIEDAQNITTEDVKTNSRLMELYEWADVVVLALKPNMHASGLTTIQEAVLRGLPVICADVGGLREYFSDEEVRYVQPRDPEAIRAAVAELARNPKVAHALAERAQALMGPGGLSSDAYVKRHVELSRELLSMQ